MCVDGRRLGEAAGRAQPAATFFIGGGRGGDGLAWSPEYVSIFSHFHFQFHDLQYIVAHMGEWVDLGV